MTHWSVNVSGPLALCGNVDMDATDGKIIYWHSELPPFDAEAMGSISSRRRPSVCQVRSLTDVHAGLFRLASWSYRTVACATIPFAAVMPGSR